MFALVFMLSGERETVRRGGERALGTEHCSLSTHPHPEKQIVLAQKTPDTRVFRGFYF